MFAGTLRVSLEHAFEPRTALINHRTNPNLSSQKHKNVPNWERPQIHTHTHTETAQTESRQKPLTKKRDSAERFHRHFISLVHKNPSGSERSHNSQTLMWLRERETLLADPRNDSESVVDSSDEELEELDSR